MINRRTLVTGMVALLTATALPGCGVFVNHPEFRYRLSVEVDTPQGLRTGSSVIAVKIGETRYRGAGGAGFHARGEAVAVDLPGGRTLFALLRSDDNGNWPAGIMLRMNPLPYGADLGAQVEAARGNTALITLPRFMAPERRVDAPRSGYPTLVTFRDIRDPKTVEKVDPDALDKSFGPGVTLRRMTVQITEDDVTTGIEKRLGWLVGMNTNIDGTSITNSNAMANMLNSNDFSRKY